MSAWFWKLKTEGRYSKTENRGKIQYKDEHIFRLTLTVCDNTYNISLGFPNIIFKETCKRTC